MLVTNVRAKITTANAGMLGYDAEATVEEEDRSVKYVYGNYYGGEVHFTVSETSLFDYLTGQSNEDPKAVFTEEYEGIGDTTESKYHKVFVVLDQVLQLMEGD